jgi:hypothetical protein
MPDNKNIRGPADAKRINIHEPYEVEYWTKTLGVTKEQLVAVVGRVGVMAENVRRYLGK